MCIRCMTVYPAVSDEGTDAIHYDLADLPAGVWDLCAVIAVP